MTASRLAIVAALAATPALVPAAAQDLPQASDEYFVAAQETLEQRLAVQPITTRARNVILFVADGNGVATNYATRLMAGQMAGGTGDDHVLPHETFPHVALVKTYTTNGQTPDSAPTAAALTTGIKTKNDLINITSNVAVSDCAGWADNQVTTVGEIMAEAGKSVGVVSTARLTHATPAAVYAKTVNRDWEDDTEVAEGCDQPDIATQLIDQMEAGVIDLAMGGGRRHFLPSAPAAGATGASGEPAVSGEPAAIGEVGEGRRGDGTDLIARAQELGATYVSDDASFAEAPLDGTPILGLFEDSHMKYEYDRTGEPSLAEMTEAAIDRARHQPRGLLPPRSRRAAWTTPTTPATSSARSPTASPSPTRWQAAMDDDRPRTRR